MDLGRSEHYFQGLREQGRPGGLIKAALCEISFATIVPLTAYKSGQLARDRVHGNIVLVFESQYCSSLSLLPHSPDA